MKRPPLDSPIWVTDLPGLKGMRSKGVPQGQPWVYLGADVKKRIQAQTCLGKENRRDFGDHLHRVAEELRQLFLDFVSQVGALQADKITWWSTRFSWRIWISSDLFLLGCYLVMAQQILQEASTNRRSLILVVEDPWAFHQLKENCAPLFRGVAFSPGSSLAWEKAKLILLGVVRRTGWLGKVAWNYLRQRLIWPQGISRIPTRPTAAVASVPLKVSVREGQAWEDPYLPGIDQMLRSRGYDVVRFSPPDQGGFERELAQRASYFEPLILKVTWSALWRSLRAFWRPRWPAPLSIQGTPMERLVQREWWLEMGRASLCGFRLFYESLRRMLESGNWRWMVFPYENQPWEKLLILCAQEKGIPTVGIQTAILSRYYLPFFLGEGEAQRMPLPDILCTSGPYPHEALIEGKHPPHRLKMCGSIRYNHLSREIPVGLRGSSPILKSEIMVVLPIDRRMSEHLLAALRGAFPTGGREEGLRFRVRPHPMSPLDPQRIGFPCQLVSSSFIDLTEALKECQTVLFIASTVGFEAISLRKRVIRYRSDYLLDVDEVYGQELPVLNDATLHDGLLEIVKSPPSSEPKEWPKPLVRQFFASFDRDRFGEIFSSGEKPESPAPQEERRPIPSVVK